ncbi:MAG: MGMT family protein [Candidatus Paceibacterota bacterium]
MSKLLNFVNPLFSFLKTIPRGRVTTYSNAAKRIGLKNPRNVSWILKQNTDRNSVPCYKVVMSNGKLAKGYKFGGEKIQKERLENDGIIFDSKNRIIDFENLVM